MEVVEIMLCRYLFCQQIFSPRCFRTCFRVDFQSYPFPKQQILDSSELKEFADCNFKFDENGRKFFVTSNFSFSHNVFKRCVLQTRKNQGLFGKELRNH